MMSLIVSLILSASAIASPPSGPRLLSSKLYTRCKKIGMITMLIPKRRQQCEAR
jgi:hypothetical protein